jgi:hypothetical protein
MIFGAIGGMKIGRGNEKINNVQPLQQGLSFLFATEDHLLRELFLADYPNIK